VTTRNCIPQQLRFVCFKYKNNSSSSGIGCLDWTDRQPQALLTSYIAFHEGGTRHTEQKDWGGKENRTKKLTRCHPKSPLSHSLGLLVLLLQSVKPIRSIKNFSFITNGLPKTLLSQMIRQIKTSQNPRKNWGAHLETCWTPLTTLRWRSFQSAQTRLQRECATWLRSPHSPKNVRVKACKVHSSLDYGRGRCLNNNNFMGAVYR